MIRFVARPSSAGRRALMARALTAAGALALPAVARPAADTKLPQPAQAGGPSIEQALARRRSVRQFTAQPLTLAAVAQLLWAAQGQSGDGWRNAPSAGALYPLELHLVAVRIEGLATGVHRYWSARHALRPESAEDIVTRLQQAALGQAAVGSAAAVVVIAAVEARTSAKYGARASRYVAFEAGAAAQNLALQAAALGLGTVVIGGFDDAAVAGLLRLPDGERAVVLVPVGWPASATRGG